MPPRPTAPRRRGRPPAAPALAVLIAAVLATSVSADGLPREAFGEPRRLNEAAPAANPLVTRAALSPFQPSGVSSRVRRTLLQHEALTADGAWDEAIDLVERLQAEAGGELTELEAPDTLGALVAEPDGHTLYAPLAATCQRLLAALPPEGLEVYRDRVGRTARERLEEGVARLDERELRRVVSEHLASESAPEALFALSELALERGDWVASRRALSRLTPLASGPYGRPAGVSLALIDPAADPATLAAAWAAAPRSETPPLAPADEATAAEAFARLALTSLREGDLRRAEAELLLLRGLALDASGRLAGRRQPLVPALTALVADQRRRAEEATHASAYGELVWAWDGAKRFKHLEEAPVQQKIPGFRVNALGQLMRVPVAAEGAADETPPPAIDAVVHDLSAFYVEQGDVKRLNLATGESTTFLLPGVPRDEADDTPRPGLGDLSQRVVVRNGRRVVQVAPNRFVATPNRGRVQRVDPQLWAVGGMLFARVVEAPAGRRVVRGAVATLGEWLIGFDPESPLEPSVRLTAPLTGDAPVPGRPGETRYEFGGPPALRGERLYVALTRPGVRTTVAVACYSTASARQLWRVELGAGEPASRFGGGHAVTVTPAGDALYVSTHLGAVAALDAATGEARWLAAYPRDAVVATRASRWQTPQREPAQPALVVGDRLLAAPADSTRLLAWDAATGRPLWDAPRPDDARIVGVVGDPDGAVVVLAGDQVSGYDALTGDRRYVWPESPRAGVRGRGAAAIAGGELFWPTRDALYPLDPTTGAMTRSPIDLRTVGAAGANIFPTPDGLLVGGPEKLRLLAALPDPTSSPRPAPPGEPAGDQTRLNPKGPDGLAQSAPPGDPR